MSNDHRDHKMGFLVELGEGFGTLVKAGITLICVLVAVIVWLVWAHFIASPEPASEPAKPQVVAPAYSPVVPDVRPVVADHKGECFSTPMGDIGKVIEQDNEMLTMTFRGGVKSTYRMDQVTSSACGPAVVK
jgi:hypothetical protein